MERNRARLIIRPMLLGGIVAMIAAACSGPQPVPTEPVPTASAVETPASTQLSTPDAVATSTAQPSISSGATETPTATPQPNATPTRVPFGPPTSTPVALASLTYTSDEYLGLAFQYVEGWDLNDDDPQRLRVSNPGGTDYAVVVADILSTTLSLDAHTRQVREDLRAELQDFLTLGQTGTDIGGIPALETRIEFSAQSGRRMAARSITTISGRMGYTFLLAAPVDASAASQRPLDLVAASSSVSEPDFLPPPPRAIGGVVDTGVDNTTVSPIGSAASFEVGVKTLFVYTNLRNVPLASEVRFLWAEFGSTGTVIRTVEDTTAAATSGPAWTFVEPTGGWTPGFYGVIVLLDGEVLAGMPFAIVREIGNEFNSALEYATWASFAAINDDGVTAVYAATKAIALDPALAAAYAVRSGAYLSQCALESALLDANAVVGLNSDDPASFAARGHIRWSLGDLVGAIADLDRAVDLADGAPGPRNNRALVHAQAGQFSSALADINAALDDVGDSLQQAYGYLDTRGYVLLKAGRYR
ncbi:MAG: hypothetical protein O3B84_04065, partial [Chloroflexi bacterium]|nr:hypothetical protein [Chloroflexota bacterium]